MPTSSLPASSKPTSVESLDDLLALSPSHLPGVDIARVNLLCAEGLPGAAGLNVDKCLAALDEWAKWVGHETDRHLYRFRCAPADYGHCEGYFRMLMLVTVLQQDFRVRYNPDRIGGIDFRDSRDLFIHGLLEEPHTGTCASMPVLYAAAGRRLGYPLRLVLTHGHVFVRWEGPEGRDRFNIECASQGMLCFPDEYYKTWPTPLTDEQVTKGRYLISLGAAEELAVFMESRGHCLLDNGRPREARMAYEHACRLDPLSPGHWSWLADALVREASLVPQGDSLNTFSKWGCSMTISCPPTANSTLCAEPVRTFRLDSTRYRNYHPTLGRWIQRDPLRYAGGMDLQEYGVGSPVNSTDWAGLAPAQPKVVTHRNLDWSDFRGTVPANAIRDASLWAHFTYIAWEPGYEVKKTAQSNCAGLTWEVEKGGRKIKGTFKADYHQCYEFKAWIKPETSLVMNFKPERSWAKPNVLAHPENHTSLLRHEQGHMRIVEALVAFYNAELAAKKPGTLLVYHCVPDIGEEKTKGVIQAYLDELYGRAERFKESLQAQYEGETGHGRNADAQKRWDALLGNAALPLTPPEPPE